MDIVIKRYSNRKLYNTNTCKYIRSEDILDYIKNGDTVTVNDTKAGDITKETLLSAIYTAKMEIPVETLISLIETYHPTNDDKCNCGSCDNEKCDCCDDLEDEDEIKSDNEDECDMDYTIE